MTIRTVSFLLNMSQSHRYTPLAIYHGYRLLIASLLLCLGLAAQYGYLTEQALSKDSLTACIAYLLLAAVAPILPKKLLLIGFLGDILALFFMLHSSSSFDPSLVVLMLVSVAAASILMPLKLGLLIAALATLLVIGEQLWLSWLTLSQGSFSAAGLLGMAFFATAILVQQMSKRLAHSESLRKVQQQAISQLEELNHQVVNELHIGTVVFDANYTVITTNPIARQMAASILVGKRLPNDFIDTFEALTETTNQHLTTHQSLNLRMRLVPLGVDVIDNPLTLLFLEDESAIEQQAQRLKLASLGRMSAIIAHEIRNPLSAIRQASELLEQQSQTNDNNALFGIIQDHILRVDNIVSSILNLSRRQHAAASQLNLSAQIAHALQQLHLQGINCDAVESSSVDDDLNVYFTESQLQQVLTNLIGNAFRHGGDSTHVIISASRLPYNGRIQLMITDNGKGFDDDAKQHLFEPFYTTVHNGTGLGLFLCRELCLANQASLRLATGNGTTGACFVLRFSPQNP